MNKDEADYEARVRLDKQQGELLVLCLKSIGFKHEPKKGYLDKSVKEAEIPEHYWILCNVLCCIPKMAVPFIKTQEYARAITGKNMVHYIVIHEKPSSGLHGNEHYGVGHHEELGLYGFTGKWILEIIDDVNHLRGCGSYGYIDYFWSTKSEDILDVYKRNATCEMNDRELPILLALCFMGFEGPDADLLCAAKVVYDKCKQIDQKIQKHRAQIASLEAKEKQIQINGFKKINKKYPRQNPPA